MQITMRHLKCIFPGVLCTLLSMPVLAKSCDNFLVMESKQPRAAVVAPEAGPRLHFQRNDVNCPGGKGCEAKAYLLPNDKIFIADDGGPWVCAYFEGPKRHTAGWLPRAALVIDSTPPAPVQQDWIGRWRSGRNFLLFDVGQGARLHIFGAAIGDGLSMTSFETDTAPNRNLILYKVGRCRITLRWVGGFILAAHTLDCCGAGNSYYGVYRRTALTTDPKDEPPDPQDE